MRPVSKKPHAMWVARPASWHAGAQGRSPQRARPASCTAALIRPAPSGRACTDSLPTVSSGPSLFIYLGTHVPTTHSTPPHLSRARSRRSCHHHHHTRSALLATVKPWHPVGHDRRLRCSWWPSACRRPQPAACRAQVIGSWWGWGCQRDGMWQVACRLGVHTTPPRPRPSRSGRALIGGSLTLRWWAQAGETPRPSPPRPILTTDRPSPCLRPSSLPRAQAAA